MNQLHTAVSLRLCYLLPSPTFGMHQYTADLANRMAAVGHDVHLVTTTHYPAGRYSPDVTVHTPIATTNTGFSTESLNLSAIQNLQSAICNLQFDLVHLTGPHLWNPLLLRALRRAGIPTLHTIHDLDPHSGAGYGRLLHLWNGLVLRWSDHVLVHGDIYRRRLLAQGYPADRVTHTPLLHLFLGHDRQLAPYNSQFLIRTSQFATSMSSFVLFFGRLEAYKGVSTLLAAWSLLNRNPPFAIRHSLLLAGQGQLTDPLPPRVELYDRLIEDDEAIDLFRNCALLVLPYHDATQSALVGAAYAFGKPVIVTRTGALPEYVDEGETGWVVPPGDAQALADCLSQALSDPERLIRMGQNGQAWYNRHRNAEWEALQRLYLKLAGATYGEESSAPDEVRGQQEAV